MNNKLAVRLSLLLFLGLALCEVHSVVYWLNPKAEFMEYDFFLEKSYHQKISVLWYTYELSNILNKIFWAFAFSQVANIISFKLFKVSIVFLIYEFSQFFLYIWDRNTSFLSNYVIYTCMGLVVVQILLPDHKTGKIKSIE